MKGTKQGCICQFAVGLVHLNKLLTMCSSDFWKYKQECAPCVSGVLQLAKTGPPVMKNFPLLCLSLSDAMMARRFYKPCDINCTYLHILAACRILHIFDSNCPTSKLEEKIHKRLSEAQTDKLGIGRLLTPIF